MPVSERDINDFLAAIHQTLYIEDFTEEECCDAVYVIHLALAQDEGLYLALWARLDAPTRRAFKGYVDSGYSRSKGAPRLELPPPD